MAGVPVSARSPVASGLQPSTNVLVERGDSDYLAPRVQTLGPNLMSHSQSGQVKDWRCRINCWGWQSDGHSVSAMVYYSDHTVTGQPFCLHSCEDPMLHMSVDLCWMELSLVICTKTWCYKRQVLSSPELPHLVWSQEVTLLLSSVQWVVIIPI